MPVERLQHLARMPMLAQLLYDIATDTPIFVEMSSAGLVVCRIDRVEKAVVLYDGATGHLIEARIKGGKVAFRDLDDGSVYEDDMRHPRDIMYDLLREARRRCR